jgi:hypothetical protein
MVTPGVHRDLTIRSTFPEHGSVSIYTYTNTSDEQHVLAPGSSYKLLPWYRIFMQYGLLRFYCCGWTCYREAIHLRKGVPRISLLYRASYKLQYARFVYSKFSP